MSPDPARIPIARRLRAAGHLVTGFLGLLVALPVGAATDWNLNELLPGPAWVWSRPQDYELSGARIRVQHFQAEMDPAQAARRLVSLSPARFVRLQLSGSSLSLSGLPGGEHWVAQLHGTATRTTGLISSLVPLDVAQNSSRFDARALVPCGGAPVLQMASRDPVVASVVRVECHGAAQPILDRLRQRLRNEQWQPIAGGVPASQALARDWRHSTGAELSLLSEVHPNRVVLTFWHRVSEPRP